MPAKIIVIDDSKRLEWYLMEPLPRLLIAFLDEIGTREKKEPEKCPNCEDWQKGLPLKRTNEGYYPNRVIKVSKQDVFTCRDCGKAIIFTEHSEFVVKE